MYKNCVFDLYGTLIDINTDEWSIELWEKMAVYYGYKGAIYTAEELNEEYGKLVEAEKKAVHRRHKDYSVIDIKIDKVFKKLYNQKGVKVTKAVVEQTCAVFRNCLDMLICPQRRFILTLRLNVLLLYIRKIIRVLKI